LLRHNRHPKAIQHLEIDNSASYTKGLRDNLEPRARAARIIEGRLEGVLAHWSRGLTSAFIERLNSLFSAGKRKARVYRKVESMTATLYSFSARLTLPCYWPPENSEESLD
jgi:hypothetical protein